VEVLARKGRVRKERSQVIETKDGPLNPLLFVDGCPLPKQQQKENQRIQKLVSSPDEQRKSTAR
jgi:hypothetical protein